MKTQQIIVLTFLSLAFLSCENERKCEGILNDSYKGYGFFIFDDFRPSGSSYEITFFPICTVDSNSIKNLDNYRSKILKASLGFSFHGSQRDENNYMKSIFNCSTRVRNLFVKDSRLSAAYITPVFISFTKKKIDYPTQIWKKWFSFNKGDTLVLNYEPTVEDFGNIFNIEQMQIFQLN